MKSNEVEIKKDFRVTVMFEVDVHLTTAQIEELRRQNRSLTTHGMLSSDVNLAKLAATNIAQEMVASLNPNVRSKTRLSESEALEL